MRIDYKSCDNVDPFVYLLNDCFLFHLHICGHPSTEKLTGPLVDFFEVLVPGVRCDRKLIIWGGHVRRKHTLNHALTLQKLSLYVIQKALPIQHQVLPEGFAVASHAAHSKQFVNLKTHLPILLQVEHFGRPLVHFDHGHAIRFVPLKYLLFNAVFEIAKVFAPAQLTSNSS